WIATVNGGAVSFNGVEWITFNSSNSGLPSNHLLSIKVNPDNGIVSFGTAGLGVAILDNPDWIVYNSSNSPIINGFISTLEYRPADGELWIGTGYGVWVLQTDGEWRGYIPPENDFIWGEFYSDIAFDSVGSVWVSAYGGGMASLMLDSIPSPPPTDSLEIDIDRMFIYFYNNKPQERIFTDLYVGEAPELTPEDTIFFRLDSDQGQLYGFEVLFADFSDQESNLDGWDSYRYRHNRLMITIRASQDDPTHMEFSVKDFNANMERDNYSNTLEVTVGIGDAVGNVIIYLTTGNQWDVPEEFGHDLKGTELVQVFEMVEPLSETADEDPLVASTMDLGNYPNPFNGRTVISFNLDDGASVAITVYDMLGRLVDNTYSGFLSAGRHSFAWPSIGTAKSGIYIYTVTVDGHSISKKMTYLK
ncbi:MAG: T9SS type A sorting domain-containing protein, partial [candidate division Zixibacteria bacterium]